MEDKDAFRPSSQLVIGILVIFLGVIFTLGNLGIVYFNIIGLWPIALIILGLYMATTAAELPGRIIALFVAAIGTLLLLKNLGLVYFRFWDFWPLILVFVGFNIVWMALQGRFQSEDSSSTISGVAILGGFNKSCSSPDFRGGELTALMGGGEVDLRHASIEADQAVLNTHAFMGGLEIYVPSDWTVTCKVFPFMGGVEDKTVKPQSGPKKELVVRGLAIMGGIEIHN
jgi:predicted membrane protein